MRTSRRRGGRQKPSAASEPKAADPLAQWLRQAAAGASPRVARLLERLAAADDGEERKGKSKRGEG